MSATDIEIKEHKQENLAPARSRAVFVYAGYSAAFTLYAAIFAVALITLGLIVIRQADMVNFNSLIANLEQRDRAPLDLQTSLDTIIKQRQEAHSVAALAKDCQSFSGPIIQAETPTEKAPKSASSSSPGNCKLYVNTVKHRANELLLTEDDVRFKLANLGVWYTNYIAGITNKMPQIIPALNFVDSKSPVIKAWARSSYGLMEMFLLVSMGMLGGIISVTRWLVKSTTPPALPTTPPALAEYFYRPVLGGIMALGVFVVFKAGQVISGGQEGATAVAASVFVLAALGLVSGLCADKALERIENAPGLSHRNDDSSGSPQEVAHSKVVELAPTGDAASRPGRMTRPKTIGLVDEPSPENPGRERAGNR